MTNRYDDQPVLRGNAGTEIDEGLRNHMLRVYNYMAMGLGITGVVAYFLSTQMGLMQAIHGTALKYVFLFAPLGLVFYISARIRTLPAKTAQTLFWVYSASMGISLSSIFLMFTGESITQVFFISASTFGAMSLYGYTTKRDLTQFGSFLFMGVIGLVLASVVNIFMQSGMMQMVISAIAVLVFTGLTAYDTQMIKEFYLESDSKETAQKKAIFGALSLYLDFINIFIALLNLFGERR